MFCSSSISKLAPALLKAQRNVKTAVKGEANTYFKSKYADLPAVIDACLDALHAENIMVLQPVGKDAQGDFVETTLVHESGEFMSEKMYLTPQTDMQKLGSAVTYARRYGLQSMLCMKAEDDDGEAAVGRGKNAPKGKVEPAVPPQASKPSETSPSATTAPASGTASPKAASQPKPSSSPKAKTAEAEAPSTGENPVLHELEELTAKLDTKKREAVLAYINKNLKNPDELVKVRDRLRLESQKTAVA